MKFTSLEELYIDQLQDLFDAENRIVKALPKMAEAATHRELKEGFKEHLSQTKEQVERLKQIFEKMGVKAGGKSCKAMEGLIEEGEEIVNAKKDANPSVLDAGLIAAAQKIEHYEIAGYGTCRTFAECLGDEDAAELLQVTLDEEGETDKKLTGIAERINTEALEEGEESEETEEHPARGKKK